MNNQIMQALEACAIECVKEENVRFSNGVELKHPIIAHSISNYADVYIDIDEESQYLSVWSEKGEFLADLYQEDFLSIAYLIARLTFLLGHWGF